MHLLHTLTETCCKIHKEPSSGVLRKRCSENMQQVYRKTFMQKGASINLLCNFTENALWHRCSPLNLMHFFRMLFPKNFPKQSIIFLLILRTMLKGKQAVQKDIVPRAKQFSWRDPRSQSLVSICLVYILRNLLFPISYLL